MATAALRGLLVLAALALGFFVLSKAFPSGDDPSAVPAEQATTTAPPVSPSVATSPTRAAPEPLDPSELEIQVLNGTDVSGLASDTAEMLEAEGYEIGTIADAETSYETTTIFHLRKRRVDAQVLQQAFFPTAVLEIAEEDTQVDMTVILGADYAAVATGETPESPAESPT